MLKILPGVMKILFGLDVIELRNEFFVGLVKAFVLEDELGDFMLKVLF